MTDLEYDATLQGGTWYLWRAKRPGVLVACPSCAGIVLVEIDDVDPDGTMVQEFCCKRQVCTFRGRLRLKGWDSSGHS